MWYVMNSSLFNVMWLLEVQVGPVFVGGCSVQVLSVEIYGSVCGVCWHVPVFSRLACV